MKEKKKIKVFISQPMNGLSDEEVFKTRDETFNLIKEAYPNIEMELIDSFIREDKPEGSNPVWYLGKSLEFLAEANVAYFCDGWENSRGCYLERHVAEAYGIGILNKLIHIYSGKVVKYNAI